MEEKENKDEKGGTFLKGGERRDISSEKELGEGDGGCGTIKWMAEKCICFLLNMSCTNGRISNTL